MTNSTLNKHMNNTLDNKRHEKYCRLLASGMSKYDAYRKTYPNASVTTANNQGHVLARREDIHDRVAEILDQDKNLSISNILKHAGKSLNAKKTVIYNSKGDSKQIPDNTARGNAQDRLLKLHGAKGFGKADTVTNNNTMNVMSLGNDAIDKLASVLSDLKSIGSGDAQGDEQDGEVVDI